MVASVRGARQVTFAIIATSLTLVAVFVPISFLEGDVGRLFGEFGFVMASAVLISTFVALTACPALASRILANQHAGAAAGGNADAHRVDSGRMTRAYRAVLDKVLDVPLGIIAIALAIVGVSYLGYHELQRELTPREDRAVLFIPLTTPQGSTLAHTDAETRKVEAAIAPGHGGGRHQHALFHRRQLAAPLPGLRGAAAGPVGRARQRSERGVELAGKAAANSSGARLSGGAGGAGHARQQQPARVVIGGPEFDSVKEWANTLKERAEQNPGLRNVEIDFEENQPQLSLEINRARADDLGISVETIASTLQTMLASQEATTYIDRGREYSAILQAQGRDRRTPDDISNMFIRAGDGETLVPLSALVTAREEAAAPELRRYNRLPSIQLSAALEGDYTLGSAIEFIEQAAAETLPPQASVGFAGQSLQYLEASQGVAIVFALAVLIVFLVLAAQFESFVHPLIIMLSVPLAVAGRHLCPVVHRPDAQPLQPDRGHSAGRPDGQERHPDRGVRQSAARRRRERARRRLDASVIRLRPILMTVISTILGAVPLVLASGAGAESRIAIGTVIIGGLGFASLLTLFLTPVLYNLMAGWSRPRRAAEQRLEAELGQLAAGGVG
jgi:multidrug efflux pump